MSGSNEVYNLLEALAFLVENFNNRFEVHWVIPPDPHRVDFNSLKTVSFSLRDNVSGRTQVKLPQLVNGQINDRQLLYIFRGFPDSINLVEEFESKFPASKK